MKNQVETMVTNGKKPYGKPMIEVVNLDVESIICGSEGIGTEPYEEGEFSWS